MAGSLKDPSQDILVEERVRRRGSLFRFLRPWSFLNRLGAGVLLFGFVISGVVVVYSGSSSDLAPGGERIGIRGGPALAPLTPSEMQRASDYGEPLYRGGGGLPVVRLSGTDTLRELTPLEWEFDSPVPFEPAGYGRVMWGPGPRGWGLWWDYGTRRRVIPPERGFDAESWRERQELELRWLADAVTVGLLSLDAFDAATWQAGPGDFLLELTGLIRERYDVPQGRAWTAVPVRWACLLELESALHQGLTQGCPSPAVMPLVLTSWYDLGVVVEHLEGLGRLAVVIDKMSPRQRANSEAEAEFWWYIEELPPLVAKSVASLDDLMFQSLELGMPMRATLFETR